MFNTLSMQDGLLLKVSRTKYRLDERKKPKVATWSLNVNCMYIEQIILCSTLTAKPSVIFVQSALCFLNVHWLRQWFINLFVQCAYQSILHVSNLHWTLNVLFNADRLMYNISHNDNVAYLYVVKCMSWYDSCLYHIYIHIHKDFK